MNFYDVFPDSEVDPSIYISIARHSSGSERYARPHAVPDNPMVIRVKGGFSDDGKRRYSSGGFWVEGWTWVSDDDVTEALFGGVRPIDPPPPLP